MDQQAVENKKLAMRLDHQLAYFPPCSEDVMSLHCREDGFFCFIL